MLPKLKRLSESFIDRADEAAFWEAYVASKLSRLGLYVGHYHWNLDDQKEDKSLSWDLDVSDGLHYEPRKTEVKSRNLTFTSWEDFPYDDVNVCSQNFFLRNWPGHDKTGRDFLIVSTKTGAILWLPAGSPVSFGKEVCDSSRGEVFKCVTVKSHYLQSLEEFVNDVKRRSS